MSTPRELQELYKQGKNITRLLREEQGLQHSTDEIIEIYRREVTLLRWKMRKWPSTIEITRQR